jgi:ABC-type transport system involved in multi-copper enzyme maturation permease subunit
MIAMIASLYLCIGAIATGALLLLQEVASDPRYLANLALWLPADGLDPAAALQALAGTVVTFFDWLVFTQFLGFAAVLAGHSVLHDRQVQALPFLLLAPIRRYELLLGKVLGAVAIPLVLYAFISGGASALAASLPVAAPYADRLPTAPAWWVAFLLGGPAWAVFVCAVCAIVSSLARDVRTAQQGVWFVMFFATFACGWLLSSLLPRGVGVQLLVAGLGAVAGAVALAAGAQVISRDLSR